MESEYKNDNPRKWIKHLPAILLAILLVLLALTLLFNFYPGSYSINKTDSEVLVEKGMFSKKAYNLTITQDTELRIALLEWNITQLKMTWYVSLISLTTIILVAFNFLKYKSKIPFIMILLIAIVILILSSISYFHDYGFIEKLLEELK